MSRRLIEAANKVRATLLPAERAQDTAALEAARCLAAALEARRLAHQPLSSDNGAIVLLAETAALAAKARQAAIEAHKLFAELPHQNGLTELGWGCTNPECPDVDKAELTVVQPLHAAA